jgi:hypothetical protein
MPPVKPWRENDGELLYNGIRLPREWPPRDVPADSREPLPVPWLDLDASTPTERYKAFLYARTTLPPDQRHSSESRLYTSPDGIRWQQGPKLIASIGDNTTLFYNPFRKKWVLSVRTHSPSRGRTRSYFETSEFAKLAAMTSGDPVFWAGADRLDLPDPAIGRPTQLYCLNAIAYESIMLGAFCIHYGPENGVYANGRFPKLTQIKLGFSRDGFHWARPDRSEFIAATQRDGDWDRAYLRPAGSVCTIVGDRIYFYYCGFSGIATDGARHMYAGGSTHVAFLRRDGFASMNAGETGGELVTRPVTFKGSHLFVNAAATNGELRVEILDEKEKVIEPFTKENCIAFSADNTLAEIGWKGAEGLSALRDTPVRFRFHLRAGSLYSFWVSPEESGASHGYVAAGGPGFSGANDTTGK